MAAHGDGTPLRDPLGPEIDSSSGDLFPPEAQSAGEVDPAEPENREEYEPGGRREQNGRAGGVVA
ncbi:hypothetical protein [Halorubrum salsamenti]|uniref:hypothetical protein n=1 Tax=Halorubrum salsamenti TaxID=2583990 RepID=UPI001642F60C|nr:hypothetical protein [Halorubrum salsamenti]